MPRKSAEERRREIVATALQLADRVGPDRLTTNAIAEAIGLSQPAVFRHFPKKTDIWEAVAAELGRLLDERWQAVLALPGRPSARLIALVMTQIELIETMPALPAILFSRELHIENDILRGLFLGLVAELGRHLAGLVVKAQAEGELDRDVNPGDAAVLLLGLIQGLALRWSLAGRGFDLTAEGRRLLALQLRGFGYRG